MEFIMQFRNAYSRETIAGFTCADDGRTDPQFKDECDLKTIVNKYRFGVLPNGIINENPCFGDFSSVPDFKEAQSIVADANNHFSGLPSNIRAFFNNSTAEFLDFVNNPDNEQKAIEMGILAQRPAVESVQQTADPVRQVESIKQDGVATSNTDKVVPSVTPATAGA